MPTTKPTKVYGPYEAAVCVSPTYTDTNALCTAEIAAAEQEAIRNGATCELNTEHLMFQNTGRISTLWSLVCTGPVMAPAAAVTQSEQIKVTPDVAPSRP